MLRLARVTFAAFLCTNMSRVDWEQQYSIVMSSDAASAPDYLEALISVLLLLAADYGAGNSGAFCALANNVSKLDFSPLQLSAFEACHASVLEALDSSLLFKQGSAVI